MFEVIAISFAFVFGLLVRQLGLPSLIGFLAAGFALHEFGPPLGMPAESGDLLQHLAHLGVLMLLFTVGLKLKLGQIAQPQVLGGSLLHFLISVGFVATAGHWLLALDWTLALQVAVALAFSSTVMAAKLLEAKRELRSFHGRSAIGILVVQDILALAALAWWGDHSPSLWALLVLGLPLLRPLLYRLMDWAGHGELLILYGLLLALVLGGMGFDAVGLSGELGALSMGVLLASHPRAKELAQSLWALKEVFLVGFFLQIGMAGWPDLPALVFALAVVVLLPLKNLLFFVLLLRFRLRARSAFLAAISLSSYSEFGLILSAALMPQYLVPLALAVALSFILAAPLNRYAHPLFERLRSRLQRYELDTLHPDEQVVDIRAVEILVVGMGRTGTAAYDQLARSGKHIMGLDADPYKVALHQAAGRRVNFADGENSLMWEATQLQQLEAVILAMNDLEANVITSQSLRRNGFIGPIISHALHEDHCQQIEQAGATHAYQTMGQAGVWLAQRTLQELRFNGEEGSE